MEGYYEVTNQAATPNQAIGLLYAFNLTDIYQSGNRIWDMVSKYSGYEDYAKLFPLLDTVKEITNLFLALLKLRVQQFMKLYIELEINNIIEVQLEQTLINVLTNSKVKVIAVRGSGGDSDAIKRKIMKPTAGVAMTKNRLKYTRSESHPGGPKKKEEKRVRELEKNYQFTFSQGNNGNN
ncbi:unnamed protein product [Trichobilharzia regenti]|nr:unnamed protein product [Trichobilharzia regenti]